MVEIITTGDGSHTLFNPELNDHYHSVHGAIQESNLVYIKNGLDFCKADTVRIFEVGFGTGLNAFLSAVYSVVRKRTIFYSSIEKYPLEQSIINLLNYKKLLKTEFSYLFENIHSCKWNYPVKILNHFNLTKIEEDLITYNLKGPFDLIYFDAFGPDKQPEMWSAEVFRKISENTASGGIFVTYSVKGIVKRNLKENGFNVDLLPGPTGKRLILRAVKR
jgi:tRNA U34 5-methylaminomethyl-2-thiouridine-forming methyltransferase MnmC